MSRHIVVDRDRFHKDGYLLIRGAFSAQEINEYRGYLNEVLSGNESFLDSDLISDTVLRSFVDDGRLIDISRQLLDGTPVYFGDSSANRYDEAAPVGTFHKDNTDRHDVDAPDWGGDYPLIRFGLYLQDHKRQGGGLLLRAGSHRKVFRNRKAEVLNEEIVDWLTGKTRYVFSELGDLVVWNMRLTHAGMGRFIRGPINRPVTERTQRIIPSFMHCAVEQTRYSMFATFAKEGAALSRHLRYLKTRRYMVDMWCKSAYPSGVFGEFESKGGHLLDMHSEVKDEIARGEPLGQYDRWHPLPY